MTNQKRRDEEWLLNKTNGNLYKTGCNTIKSISRLQENLNWISQYNENQPFEKVGESWLLNKKIEKLYKTRCNTKDIALKDCMKGRFELANTMKDNHSKKLVRDGC